ncbi:NAD-dependent epimerase/dehydratase family protein [Gordonia sp. OPL2]|uniref:NAD-dependent epimerase/dehydratase family protein n=1 Tax=Gordonia sp. OPL2 TaxID=2486274 RepID=UPI0016564AC7|nr:NAD-dependent epimerase/dehydratase family protein [Gordonia sp. OPL2]RPA12157.1 NAD-dependent epimerase/dehydratase family protein [Gordonia sp. OPL2]
MSGPVLVTGADGHIGGWIVADLIGHGRRVRAVVADPVHFHDLRAAIGDAGGDPDRLEIATVALSSDDGWDAALDGVDAVVHTAAASGAPGAGGPDDTVAADIVERVVGGTRRLIGAAAAAGVRRVVMTSAVGAAAPETFADDTPSDESVWTRTDLDPDDDPIPRRLLTPIAERAAFRLVEQPGTPELVTILPGAVLGPLLSSSAVGATGVIHQMLTGRAPRIPAIGVEVTDVRDLAAVHLRALDAPRAAGQRFLVTGEFLWMREIAETLRERLGSDAAEVSTKGMPDRLIRLLGRRTPALASVLPLLGRRIRHDPSRARDVLGWEPRPARDTVADCARSLIEFGIR